MLKYIESKSSTNISLTRYEEFWVERLSNLQPMTIPYAKQVATLKNQHEDFIMPVPDELIAILTKRFPAFKQGDCLFAIILSYLARISGIACFDIGLTDAELTQEIADLDSCFATCIPCRIEINLAQGLEEIVKTVQGQITFAKQHKSYALDVANRYPVLDSLTGILNEQLFPVVVERVSNLQDFNNNQATTFGHNITIGIPEDGTVCCWRYDPEVLDSDSIVRMLGQFKALLWAMPYP